MLKLHTQWQYLGTQPVPTAKGEIHWLVFVENGEVTTCGEKHAWHGPKADFSRLFKPVSA